MTSILLTRLVFHTLLIASVVTSTLTVFDSVKETPTGDRTPQFIFSIILTSLLGIVLLYTLKTLSSDYSNTNPLRKGNSLQLLVAIGTCMVSASSAWVFYSGTECNTYFYWIAMALSFFGASAGCVGIASIAFCNEYDGTCAKLNVGSDDYR
jgi:hypothetical protein